MKLVEFIYKLGSSLSVNTMSVIEELKTKGLENLLIVDEEGIETNADIAFICPECCRSVDFQSFNMAHKKCVSCLGITNKNVAAKS